MTCECGCGEIPARGSFAPGHDQRLRASLEKRIGGLIALRSLVESAEKLAAFDITPEEHVATVKGLLHSRSAARLGG